MFETLHVERKDRAEEMAQWVKIVAARSLLFIVVQITVFMSIG